METVSQPSSQYRGATPPTPVLPARRICCIADLELSEIKFALEQLPTLTAAAEALGIAVRTLQRKIKQHRLDRADTRTVKEISSGKSS